MHFLVVDFAAHALHHGPSVIALGEQAMQGVGERRSSRRRTIFLPVTLTTAAGATTPALVCDLSLGGARVMPYFVRLLPGERVQIHFGSNGGALLGARVAWASDAPSSAAGLQFLAPAEAEPVVRALLLDAGG